MHSSVGCAQYQHEEESDGHLERVYERMYRVNKQSQHQTVLAYNKIVLMYYRYLIDKYFNRLKYARYIISSYNLKIDRVRQTTRHNTLKRCLVALKVHRDSCSLHNRTLLGQHFHDRDLKVLGRCLQSLRDLRAGSVERQRTAYRRFTRGTVRRVFGCLKRYKREVEVGREETARRYRYMSGIGRSMEKLRDNMDNNRLIYDRMRAKKLKRVFGGFKERVESLRTAYAEISRMDSISRMRRGMVMWRDRFIHSTLENTIGRTMMIKLFFSRARHFLLYVKDEYSVEVRKKQLVFNRWVRYVKKSKQLDAVYDKILSNRMRYMIVQWKYNTRYLKSIHLYDKRVKKRVIDSIREVMDGNNKKVSEMFCKRRINRLRSSLSIIRQYKTEMKEKKYRATISNTYHTFNCMKKVIDILWDNRVENDRKLKVSKDHHRISTLKKSLNELVLYYKYNSNLSKNYEDAMRSYRERIKKIIEHTTGTMRHVMRDGSIVVGKGKGAHREERDELGFGREEDQEEMDYAGQEDGRRDSGIKREDDDLHKESVDNNSISVKNDHINNLMMKENMMQEYISTFNNKVRMNPIQSSIGDNRGVHTDKDGLIGELESLLDTYRHTQGSDHHHTVHIKQRIKYLYHIIYNI